MDLRSIDEFYDAVTNEMAWRTHELSFYRTRVIQAPVKAESKIVRGSIPILYAHWEGGVKRVSEIYLEYVGEYTRRSRSKLCDLNLNFAAVHIWKAGLCVQENPGAFVERVASQLNQDSRITFSAENVIRTYANLTYERFKRILDIFELDVRNYEAKENLIDLRLVKWRNDIAHGERLEVPKADYLFVEEEILDVVQRFKDEIVNAAVQKMFLKPDLRV